MTRRLRRGSRARYPLWFSRQLRCPKVSKGRAESPLVRPQAHTPLPRRGLTRRLRRGWWGCRPMGFSPASVPEGFQRASGKPFGAPAGAYPLPRRGLARRLRRGSRACSPMGRSHFAFDGERKVCKRKPAARRLREKALYCPFWRRGSLCRAQHDWPAFTCDPARSELAFFRRQNGRAFFPPLPIAALAPAVGGKHT